MNKFAHAHSVLIQNRQIRARIERKECSHFNEVGRKLIFFNANRMRPSIWIRMDYFPSVFPHRVLNNHVLYI